MSSSSKGGVIIIIILILGGTFHDVVLDRQEEVPLLVGLLEGKGLGYVELLLNQLLGVEGALDEGALLEVVDVLGLLVLVSFSLFEVDHLEACDVAGGLVQLGGDDVGVLFLGLRLGVLLVEGVGLLDQFGLLDVQLVRVVLLLLDRLDQILRGERPLHLDLGPRLRPNELVEIGALYPRVVLLILGLLHRALDPHDVLIDEGAVHHVAENPGGGRQQ